MMQIENNFLAFIRPYTLYLYMPSHSMAKYSRIPHLNFFERFESVFANNHRWSHEIFKTLTRID